MTINVRRIYLKIAIFELHLEKLSFDVHTMSNVGFPCYWLNWITVKGDSQTRKKSLATHLVEIAYLLFSG
jgi:hypothetical protein